LEGETVSDDLSKKNCSICLNAKRCAYINPYVGHYCIGLEMIINNKSPLKEPLANDLIGEGYEGFTNKSYLDVLNDGADQKERIHDMSVDAIREMATGTVRQDLKKAILSLLWFGVPKVTIRRLLRIGRTLFADIVKEAKKEYGK
jgi:hypothetical protein